MSAALLLKLGELLLTLGPQFVENVKVITAAGKATPEELATLNAMIEEMDTKRMASWEAEKAAFAAIQP